MPPTNGSNGRFELPKLGPLDSLTAGTDIPPPPESPKQQKPPVETKSENISAPVEGAPVASATPATPAVASQSPSEVPKYTNGVSRTTQPDNANLPISPGRPSSVRRLFSRKSVYGDINFASSSDKLSRPDSSGNTSVSSRPTLSKKRNSSWFRRFIGNGEKESKTGENKRASVVFEEPEEPPAKKISAGPPPPQLPQLNQLKSRVEGDSLGGEDLFKNIH